ncbi:DUF4307 domain-containing protein [Symbioplanes lichenis]|uniref:DUF4307 domain-containing protein n=1 Tax=Symbioplanes lichenis TaxID=1629072 RepID=UPI002738F33B|nr:DUF4307 domain-containing protein [Actinoplanes lichenis]
MSETRATAPVFPPGRYGRRRDGRRRLTGPIVFAVVIAVAVIALSVRLYGQYGDPDYDAQIIGWGDVTDTSMTIRFSVRVPSGGSATCGLRARDYDGYEVGRATVTVSAKGDDRTIEAAEKVPTKSRASVGDVIRCDAPR